jgi:hypothetical protein
MAYDAVDAERERQIEKFGIQTHPFSDAPTFKTALRLTRETYDRETAEGNVTWDTILLEEVWEALTSAYVAGPWENRKAELIQVAAVAVAAWTDMVRQEHDNARIDA